MAYTNKKALLVVTPPRGKGERKVVESEGIIFFSLDKTRQKITIASGFTGEQDALEVLLLGLEQNVFDLLKQIETSLHKDSLKKLN